MRKMTLGHKFRDLNGKAMTLGRDLRSLNGKRNDTGS